MVWQALQTCGQDILRSKGILDFAGIDDYVFQGVHMLMDASPWVHGQRTKGEVHG